MLRPVLPRAGRRDDRRHRASRCPTTRAPMEGEFGADRPPRGRGRAQPLRRCPGRRARRGRPGRARPTSTSAAANTTPAARWSAARPPTASAPGCAGGASWRPARPAGLPPRRALRPRRGDLRVHRRDVGRVGRGLRRGAVGGGRRDPAAPAPARAAVGRGPASGAGGSAHGGAGRRLGAARASWPASSPQRARRGREEILDAVAARMARRIADRRDRRGGRRPRGRDAARSRRARARARTRPRRSRTGSGRRSARPCAGRRPARACAARPPPSGCRRGAQRGW